MHHSKIILCLSMFSLTCNSASLLHTLENASSRLTRVSTVRPLFSFPLLHNPWDRNFATKKPLVVGTDSKSYAQLDLSEPKVKTKPIKPKKPPILGGDGKEWNRRAWDKAIHEFRTNCLATEIKPFDLMLGEIGEEFSKRLEEIGTYIAMGADPGQFRGTSIHRDLVESEIQFRNQLASMEKSGLDLSPIASPRKKFEKLTENYYKLIKTE